MFLRVSFLQQRSGKRGVSYRYRREVPSDLRDATGKREWLFNFPRGASENQMVAGCRELAIAHDALIVALRSGAPLSVAVRPAIEAEARILAAGGAEAIAFALAEARDNAVADHKQAQADAGGSRITAVGAALPPLQAAVIGAARAGGVFNPNLNTLSAVYEAVKKSAPITSEKTRKLAVDLWTAVNGDLDPLDWQRAHVTRFVEHIRKRGNGDNTILKRVSSIQGIHTRRHIEQSRTPPPIFQKLDLNVGDPESKVLPFHTWHLTKISDYLAASKINAETRAAIILMRHSTLGATELSRLKSTDVNFKAAIPYGFVRQQTKGVKERRRYFPLTAEAVEALQSLKPAADGRFFRRSPNTQSQTLAKALRAAGVPASKRLVPYSFRHTMRQALRDGGARHDLIEAMMGHRSSVPDGYGSSAADMREMMAALTAAIPRLGDVEPMQFLLEELPEEHR